MKLRRSARHSFPWLGGPCSKGDIIKRPSCLDLDIQFVRLRPLSVYSTRLGRPFIRALSPFLCARGSVSWCRRSKHAPFRVLCRSCRFVSCCLPHVMSLTRSQSETKRLTASATYPLSIARHQCHTSSKRWEGQRRPFLRLQAGPRREPC